MNAAARHERIEPEADERDREIALLRERVKSPHIPVDHLYRKGRAMDGRFICRACAIEWELLQMGRPENWSGAVYPLPMSNAAKLQMAGFYPGDIRRLAQVQGEEYARGYVDGTVLRKQLCAASEATRPRTDEYLRGFDAGLR